MCLGGLRVSEISASFVNFLIELNIGTSFVKLKTSLMCMDQLRIFNGIICDFLAEFLIRNDSYYNLSNLEIEVEGMGGSV